MNCTYLDNVSQVIIPQFDRGVYFGWLIESEYKGNKQRERYAAAVEVYDNYGVETLGDLRAAIEAEQGKPVSKPLKVSPVTPPKPEKITASIRPEMFFAADRNKLGGALRLLILAKALDKPGSGVVKKDELMSAALDLGVKRRSFYRWLARCLEVGFMKQLHRRSGEALGLANYGKAAKIAGCKRVGRSVIISAEDLFKKNHIMWAAYLAKHSRAKTVEYLDPKTQRAAKKIVFIPQPISRARLEELTGVDRVTMWRYEKQAGIKTCKNYAESNIPREHLSVAADVYGKPHAFEGYKFVCWRLPNRYKVPSKLAAVGANGARRKINQYLRVNEGCLLLEMALEDDDVKRVFFDDTKSADKAIRRRNEFDNGEAYAKKPLWIPEGMKRPKRTNTRLWDVVNTGIELQP